MQSNNVIVTFRHVRHSPALVRHIETEAQRLQRRHDCIEGCRVIIEKPHQRHKCGNHLRAKVLVSVPGRLLFSSRDITGELENEDAHAAVTAAFGVIEHSVNRFLHRRHKHFRPSLALAFLANEGEVEDDAKTSLM